MATDQQNGCGSSSSTPVRDTAPVNNNRPYSLPINCYVTITDQDNDAQNRCSIGESNSSNVVENPALKEKVGQYCASLPDCHKFPIVTNSVQENPQHISNTKCDEPKRVAQCIPRNMSTLTKMMISFCPVSANRVDRLITRLLNASETQNVDEVISILQVEANPNATCRAGHISACHAAAYANSDALHSLLKFHANKDRRDKFGRKPLHLAALAGETLAIAMLLDFPIDLQHRVISEITPELEKEIKELRPRLASLIDVRCELPTVSDLPQTWKHSIEHNCKNFMTLIPLIFSGWTPLHIASYAAHPDAARLLLAAGANPNSKDAMGMTPLDIAGAACYLDSSENHEDECRFVETIKILIEYGGNLNTSNSSSCNSALHTAVELGSLEAIRMLLAAGAPIGHRNTKGNTPLHECVAKKQLEPLRILANHRGRDQSFQSVDVMNSSGYNVLHAIILASWVPGVCVALEAGASVTLEAHGGKTALHVAAFKGNLDILNEIIHKAASIGNIYDIVNYSNGRTEPPIFNAIRSGNPQCVKTFLDAGALLKMTCYVEPTSGETITTTTLNMILHATAEAGDVDMLELLLNHDKNLEQLLYKKCPHLEAMIPVEFAAHHNKYFTFEFLLHKTLEQNYQSLGTFDHSRLLHIIVIKNREDMFLELISQIPNAVRTTNGFYPLHDAIRNNHRNMIEQLIYNGADLSEKNRQGNTAISLLIDNLSKPTEFLAEIFDDYVNMSNTTDNTDGIITLDFRALIPIKENNVESKQARRDHQMRVLAAFLDTNNRKNERKLLKHPLIETFLYEKWLVLRLYFCISMCLDSLFVYFFSLYTVFVYCNIDTHNETMPTELENKDFCYSVTETLIMVAILFVIVVFKDLSNVTISSIKFKLTVKNISFQSRIKIVTYCMVIVTLSIISPDSEIPSGAIDWPRHVTTATVIMAWLTVMINIYDIPEGYYYMDMFLMALSKVFEVFFWFLCFFIAMFTFCFMIQFHSQKPFDGLGASAVKILVMMTSEFEYADIFQDKNLKISTSIDLLRFIFVIFVILISIVMMNLLVGVAIDVQSLLQEGNLKRLEKLVKFLYKLEASRENSYLYRFISRFFSRKSKVPQKVNSKVLNANSPKPTRICKALNIIVQKRQYKFEEREEKIKFKSTSCSQDMLNHIFVLKSNLEHVQSSLNKLTDIWTRCSEGKK